jgi:hypothetical protein
MKKLVLTLCFCFATCLNAAEITAERVNNEVYLLKIIGQIFEDDGRKFRELSQNIKRAVVVLDSPGGSVLGGLEIGRNIKNNNYFTAVPNKTLCASSCALIWLAGTKRFAEDDSFVGFHAAYVYKNGKPVESGSGNALVGAYLNQIGLTDRAIVFVTNAPPEGITRLDKKLSQTYGISYSSVDDKNTEVVVRKETTNVRPTEPIEIVKKFYDALARSDGDTAASLVTPTKRGIGPFNEKNIANFFGNMKVPLAVNNIQKITETIFQVKYSYTFTKTQCNGTATVETENVLDNILIKKISANC